MDTFKKVAVIGGGKMGNKIARLLSLHNIPVILKETDAKYLKKALAMTTVGGDDPIDWAREPEAGYVVNPLIKGTTDYKDIKDADLIIEAVPEDVNIKRKVYKEILKVARKDAVIATISSALTLEQMSADMKDNDKKRFVALHFFCPADVMKIVEVRYYSQTPDELRQAIGFLLRKLGKVPIVTSGTPGYLVNRVTDIFLNEAVNCVMDGMEIDAADKIMRDFGMVFEPFKLMDILGAQFVYQVSSILEKGLDSPRTKMSPAITRLYEASKAGKNTSYFVYENNIKKGVNRGIYDIMNRTNREQKEPSSHYLKRMVYAVINEVACCLEEKVITSYIDADLGLILGMGFPILKGGPLKYADSVGIKNIVRELDELRKIYGSRFKCAQLLRDMAAKNERFYPVYDIWGVRPAIIASFMKDKAARPPKKEGFVRVRNFFKKVNPISRVLSLFL